MCLIYGYYKNIVESWNKTTDIAHGAAGEGLLATEEVAVSIPAFRQKLNRVYIRPIIQAMLS